MKLLLKTPIFGFPAKDFADSLDVYDMTFSARYLDETDMDKFGKAHSLKGEKHWEADKYNILFMDCADKDLPKLLQQMKDQQICEVVAEVDQSYEVIGEPLYVDEALDALLKKQGRSLLSQNVKHREQNFVPRAKPE